jgi:hypothetical protein
MEEHIGLVQHSIASHLAMALGQPTEGEEDEPGNIARQV